MQLSLFSKNESEFRAVYVIHVIAFRFSLHNIKRALMFSDFGHYFSALSNNERKIWWSQLRSSSEKQKYPRFQSLTDWVI